MSSYLATINRLILENAARLGPAAIHMGENIDKGSCLCGLTRGLGSGRVLNTGNCENTHVGVGLGVMRNGGTAMLYVKQLDFLMLAADQLVNTTSLLRCTPATGSFTIVSIVCDQGLQGPQSSLQTMTSLASIARVDLYTVNTEAEARWAFESCYGAPGFRLITVSQRMFAEPVPQPPLIDRDARGGWFRYGAGDAATVACFGFSISLGLDLAARLGGSAFSLQFVEPRDWRPVARHAAKSGRLYLLDSGKDGVSPAHALARETLALAPATQLKTWTRESELETAVNADRFAPELAHA